MAPSNSSIPAERTPVEEIILTVRGERVILDHDLARLYGVTTKALNQAVQRNLDRFPPDFAFQLNPKNAIEPQSTQSTQRNSLYPRRRRGNAWMSHPE